MVVSYNNTWFSVLIRYGKQLWSYIVSIFNQIYIHTCILNFTYLGFKILLMIFEFMISALNFEYFAAAGSEDFPRVSGWVDTRFSHVSTRLFPRLERREKNSLIKSDDRKFWDKASAELIEFPPRLNDPSKLSVRTFNGYKRDQFSIGKKEQYRF